MNTRHKILLTSSGVIVLTILFDLVINAFTGHQFFQPFLTHHRIGPGTLLAAVVAVGVALLLIDTLRVRYSDRLADPPSEDLDPHVKKFFESLSERYEKRYRSKLGERFEIPLEAVAYFGEIDPSLFPERSDDVTRSSAIDTICETFASRGRLLILGNPGVGKTVLLLKLALQLLDNIKDPNKEAFPVIFNLSAWSSYANFGDWLKLKLVSEYDLQERFAETLLQEQRIILLLDGLDELGTSEWWERDKIGILDELSRADLFMKTDTLARANCLSSLNRYLSEGRRAVICCRIEEYKQIAEAHEGAPVVATVQVFNLNKDQLQAALNSALADRNIRHHAAANNLLKMCETDKDGGLLEVLSTPFYFTIAMELFDQQILKEKDIPKVTPEIQDYLIDKLVKRKLSTSGSRAFRSSQSTEWLKWLAQLMDRKRFVTFEIGDLRPADLAERWLYRFWLKLVTGLIFGIVAGLVGGLISGLVFGLIGAFFGDETHFDGINEIGPISRIRWSEVFRRWYWAVALKGFLLSIAYGLLYLFVCGLILTFVLPAKYLTVGYSVSFVVITNIFLFILLFGLLYMLQAPEFVAHNERPYKKMYAGFRSNLIFAWLILLVLVAFNYWLRGIVDTNQAITKNVMNVLVLLLPVVLITDTTLFKHLILRWCLYLKEVIPLRYVTFLNYATSLQILEKDNAQWRFRHRNLQEYFLHLTSPEENSDRYRISVGKLDM